MASESHEIVIDCVYIAGDSSDTTLCETLAVWNIFLAASSVDISRSLQISNSLTVNLPRPAVPKIHFAFRVWFVYFA